MNWINHPLDYEFFDASDFCDQNYEQIKKIWEIITWEATNYPEKIELTEDMLAVIIASFIYLEVDQEEMKVPFPCVDEEVLKDEDGERFTALVNILIVICTIFSLQEKGVVESEDNEQTWKLTNLGRRIGEKIIKDETA